MRLGQPRVGRAAAGGAAARCRGQDGGMRSSIAWLFRFEFEGLAGQSESDPMSHRSDGAFERCFSINSARGRQSEI